MRKKRFAVIFLVIIITLFVVVINNKKESDVVTYNGTNLLISVDGQATNILPTTGVYYLTNYTCDDVNTVVNWDYKNYKLTVSNGKNGGSASCDLEFKTSLNKLLSEVPLGSYVKYTGYGGTVGTTAVACKNGGSASSSTSTAETEAPNSCSGQNAREDFDTSGYTYGYCYNRIYKFYVTGWRLAYVEDGEPVIISAGSPECNYREESIENEVYSQKADALSLKYCNSNFTAGNCICNSVRDGFCSSSSTDAAGIDGFKFNKMTKALFGVSTYLYVTLSGEDNTIKCGGTYSVKECGYNNDLIDNGGYYWFGAKEALSSTGGVFWFPDGRFVSHVSDTYDAFGLRPVINLSSSVIVTGGSGTMDDPYTIANNSFSINNGFAYSTSSTVTLRFSALPDVTQMCISTTSDECTNYVAFADNSSLDLGEDGEKTVYVYYKNAAGDVVASLTETVTVDTVAPTSGSISIDNGSSSYLKTLIISANDADYMCLSDTGNTLNDCTWVDYKQRYNWAFSMGDGDKTIYVYFKDAAGNTIGPYSKTITCSDGECGYQYWIDAYSGSYVYLMRSDGATARQKTSDVAVTWYSEGSQEMRVCDAYTRNTTTYSIWCIGEDNKAYYKTSFSADSWNVIDVSSYFDVGKYSYYIYPHTNTVLYVIRSDGRGNSITVSTGAIKDANWSYMEGRTMAACSGYSSSRFICIGADGYYYYRTSLAAGSYSGGQIKNANAPDLRDKDNTWIDMYYKSSSNTSYYVHGIEVKSDRIYNSTHTHTATSDAWVSSSITGGVKACASGGYGLAYNKVLNFCLAKDGYLYSKLYSATSWTKSTLIYEDE